MSQDQTRDEARKAVLAAAQHYVERGWQPIPVARGEKNPNRKGWQTERRTAADLDADFGRNLVNIGVLTGEPSGGLVDIDVDCAEALRLALTFLPETDAVFGRDGKPSSHWLYLVDDPGDTVQYEASRGAMLVEYRGTGTQTIFPPSVTSEAVRWEKNGEPRRIDAAILRQQVGRLAAASLLAREWPVEGSRHAASLALCGGLLRARWSEEDVAEFLLAVVTVAGDEEAAKRLDNVRTTAAKLASGEPATGWNKLREIIGAQALQKVQRWLGIDARAQHDASGESAGGGLYKERDGKLFWQRPSRDGTTDVQLANFTARIVGDIVTDDGVDRRRSWEIEAHLGERTARGKVPVERFASLNWAVELLGASAVVSAGNAVRDHARAAIQSLSGYTEERRVYSHFGWRKVGDEWFYLHADGAIGKDGPAPYVEVAPPTSLGRFTLPDPVDGVLLRVAIRASLSIMNVAPDSVTAPLNATAYRAPLGSMDGGVHLVGMSGAGKSELAALSQQHFGAEMDRTHLPASWASTANSLEALAFTVKDCVLVVDDFAPSGSAQDVQRYHRDADRLFRAQGNNAGRQRLSADATLRGAKYPRGLILSTGEDVVKGHSARARVLNVDVPRDGVDFKLLTQLQRVAADGKLALAMSGYVRWLAGRYDEVQQQTREMVISLRDQAHASHLHRRTPELVANFAVGWHFWLDYCLDVGAISAEERETLWARAWAGLGEAAAQQNAQQQESDPPRRFLSLLAAAIASGDAHLASPHGEAPANPGAWGWRDRSRSVSEYPTPDWREQGSRIGWLDGDGIYLEPMAAFKAAQREGAASGEPLSIGQRVLSRLLYERKLLVSAERDRERYTVRRDLGGQRRYVLHLPLRVFEAGGPETKAQTAQAAPESDNGARPSWSHAARGPFVGASQRQQGAGTAQENGPRRDGYQEGTTSSGPSGPFGPVSDAERPNGGERFVGWRCSGCRALESTPLDEGTRRCAGCGACTDEAGRVLCEGCGVPAEEGQKRRCLTCVNDAGGAA